MAKTYFLCTADNIISILSLASSMDVSKIKKKFPKGIVISKGVLQENLSNFSKSYGEETKEFLHYIFGDFAKEIFVYVKEAKSISNEK